MRCEKWSFRAAFCGLKGSRRQLQNRQILHALRQESQAHLGSAKPVVFSQLWWNFHDIFWMHGWKPTWNGRGDIHPAFPLASNTSKGHGWCFDASRTWCRHTPVAALRGVHLSFPVLFWASTKADRRSEKCFDAVIGEMEAEDYISMGWWLGVWGRRWCGGSLAEGLAEHGFCCRIPQFVCFFLLKDSFCWSTIITY